VRAASWRRGAEGWHSHLREQLKMMRSIWDDLWVNPDAS
jgi:hypothetical protein